MKNKEPEIKKDEDGNLVAVFDDEFVYDCLLSLCATIENTVQGRTNEELKNDIIIEVRSVATSIIDFCENIKCSELIKQLYVNKLIKAIRENLREIEKGE